MESQFGPNSLDEPDLQYQLQRKLKVFSTDDQLLNRGYNLVTSSSKYGLVFVASPAGELAIYHLQHLVDKSYESPQHLPVKLPFQPTHISVSCDNESLAVIGGSNIAIYGIKGFQTHNISPVTSSKLGVSPTTFVSSVQWNPCIPDTIAIAYYDGTLAVLTVTSKQSLTCQQIQAKARCICWSPKGKQLVVGNNDGTLVQYKPDLTAMKTVPSPNIFEGAPVEALAIYWISTYQFAVVYKNASEDKRPALTIVNTPKGGQPSCINYEDICYSTGLDRPWYYYLQSLPQWNIILTSSSNSMEMATLGTSDGANWMQWTQADHARPELPLVDKKKEDYPVGLCLDTCGVHQLPWGENETLPHMPLLHVVSQSGVLVTFNVINLKKSAPQICAPPQALALPPAAMTSDVIGGVKQSAPASAPAPAPAPAAAPAPAPAPQLFKPQPTLPPYAPSQPQAAPAPPLAAFGQAFSLTAAAPPPPAEQPAPAKPEPAPASQPQTILNVPKPQPQAQPRPAPATPLTPHAQELNAALKADQERANMLRANQELRNMLLNEVNDFQTELYKFKVATREKLIAADAALRAAEAGAAAGGAAAAAGAAALRRCAPGELRAALAELRLDLVRTCAVVAEARSHVDAKDHQWSQIDPLSTKRLASVKRLAYYVETQLEQAHRALDHKWTDMQNKDIHKPAYQMLRPILDDVYQPLVKQQEILGRQQTVLRALRGTLRDCDADPPLPRTASIIRSTPFRNKDPLSKLTKNILNMSIEPPSSRDTLRSQKLDALRDMLSDHKTVKIKPVNMELREQLISMRKSYEKSLKEKVAAQNGKAAAPAQNVAPQNGIKQDVMSSFTLKQPTTKKLDAPPASVSSVLSIPSVPSVPSVPIVPSNVRKPIPTFGNAARTLFADEPQPAAPPKTEQDKPAAFTPAPGSAKSVLKDMLQSKAQAEADSTFMGQKICSPTSFAAPASAPPPSSTPNVATSKPISDMTNMFSKYQPQPMFGLDAKPATKPAAAKLSENAVEREAKKEVVSVPFAVKEPSNQTATDIPKPAATTTFSFGKIDGIIKLEPKEKVAEKENIVTIVKPIPTLAKVEKPVGASEKENTPAVVETSPAPVTLSNTASATITIKAKPQPKAEPPPAAAPPASAASSLFAAANAASPESKPSLFAAKSPSVFTSPAQPAATSPPKSGSVFGAAAAPAPASPPPASVFSSASAVASSIFAQAVASSADMSATSAASPSAASVFAGAASKPSVFSAPAPASPSVFGFSQPAFSSAPTTQGSLFAASTQASSPTFTTATTTQSPFGAQTPKSVFGAGSVFSTPTTTQAQSVFAGSPFGAAPASTAASIFASAASPPSGLFATSGAASGTSSPSGLFAAANATSGAAGGAAFGAPENLFAAASISPQSGAPQPSGSIFGGSSPSAFGGGGNVFGGKAAFGAAAGGVTSQAAGGAAGVFGAPAFGAKPANPWASTGSAFGAPAFGQQTTQASPFGGGGGSFSTPAASPGGAFSTPQKQTSPAFGSSPLFGGGAKVGGFGQPAGFGAASGFGAPAFNKSPSGGFGAPAAFGGAAFGGGGLGGGLGGGGGGFGAQPAAGASFGAPQQANSTFENLATQNTLTFGNLAQQSGQPQPSFNTSPSFTGWRG